MVAVTYGAARVPESAAQARPTTARKNVISRFFDAMLEARLRHAEREIARYAYFFERNANPRGNAFENIDNRKSLGG